VLVEIVNMNIVDSFSGSPCYGKPGNISDIFLSWKCIILVVG